MKCVPSPAGEIPVLPRPVYIFWPELCIFCCQTPTSRTRCSDVLSAFQGPGCREFPWVGSVSLCKDSWLRDLQPEPVFRAGIQIFPVLATTDPSLATVGVPALLFGAFPGAGCCRGWL